MAAMDADGGGPSVNPGRPTRAKGGVHTIGPKVAMLNMRYCARHAAFICTHEMRSPQDLLRALKSEADALQAVHSNLRLNIQKLQVLGQVTHGACLHHVSHATGG